jgi:hypothetical protein
MTPQTITVIRGDGIGPEIMDAALHVLGAMDVGLSYEFADAGLAALEKTGELLEVLPQSDIHRAEAGAVRRGERALEREMGAADAVDGGVRERGAGGFHRRHARELFFPVEREASGLEHPDGLHGDLRADAVTRNEGRLVGH